MNDVMLVTEDGEEREVEYQTGVWQHSCGSQLFFLHDDGTVECSRCCGFLSTHRWTKDAKHV
jgi:hypothetical protein